MQENHLKGKKVLFLGIKNCINSKKALEILYVSGCIVTPVLGKKRNETLPDKVLNWSGDYIFSYRCYWLIPKRIIDKAKFLAINFHPAPPSFPGSGSYCWAIYKSSKEYGVTIHMMNEKFDSGKILEVYSFPIFEGIKVSQLIEITYKFSLDCFEKYINSIKSKSDDEISYLKQSNSKYKWLDKPKKLSDLNEMRLINVKMSNNEIKKRIRAFHFNDYPIYLDFHGYKFKLIHED